MTSAAESANGSTAPMAKETRWLFNSMRTSHLSLPLRPKGRLALWLPIVATHWHFARSRMPRWQLSLPDSPIRPPNGSPITAQRT